MLPFVVLFIHCFIVSFFFFLTSCLFFILPTPSSLGIFINLSLPPALICHQAVVYGSSAFQFLHSSFTSHPPSSIHRLLVLKARPMICSLKYIIPPSSVSRLIHPSTPPAPVPFLHFSSKPSSISVCFRAVSSTNLASTFSCSSKGFRSGRQEDE